MVVMLPQATFMVKCSLIFCTYIGCWRMHATWPIFDFRGWQINYIA